MTPKGSSVRSKFAIMPFFEAIRLALKMIWAHKMKSAFSVIGVFIGVTFLIAVVTIVQGMNSYMTERFAGSLLGVNTFSVRQRPSIQVGNVSRETRRTWRRRPRITYDDAVAIERGLETPVLTSWESTARATVKFETKEASGIEIIGATASYFDIKGWKIAQGRAFSGQEVRVGAPTVVLGYELADRLFESRNPIGRTVRIRDFPYTVVGVVERQGNIFGLSLDKFAVAPARSQVRRFVNPPDVIDGLVVKASSQEDFVAAMAEAEAIMRSRHHLRPTEDNDFTLQTSEGVLDFWDKINRVLLTALPGLVSISLVVGGIVITNIMLMSVAERTREIGIRKSLGARRKDIMHQFLVESATLSTVGAGAGIGTGLLLSSIVAATTFLPVRVAPWSIVVAVILGIGVGVGAGIYPASKAARLDPVDAIRHE